MIYFFLPFVIIFIVNDGLYAGPHVVGWKSESDIFFKKKLLGKEKRKVELVILGCFP